MKYLVIAFILCSCATKQVQDKHFNEVGLSLTSVFSTLGGNSIIDTMIIVSNEIDTVLVDLDNTNFSQTQFDILYYTKTSILGKSKDDLIDSSVSKAEHDFSNPRRAPRHFKIRTKEYRLMQKKQGLLNGIYKVYLSRDSFFVCTFYNGTPFKKNSLNVFKYYKNETLYKTEYYRYDTDTNTFPFLKKDIIISKNGKIYRKVYDWDDMKQHKLYMEGVYKKKGIKYELIEGNSYVYSMDIPIYRRNYKNDTLNSVFNLIKNNNTENSNQ